MMNDDTEMYNNFKNNFKGVTLVKVMDALQTSSSESDPKQVMTSKKCEPTNFRNNSHSDRILEDLQSLRKYVKGDFSLIKN